MQIKNNSLSVNITQLTHISSVQATDFIIVDTADGTGIVDYENLTVTSDQITFMPIIEDVSANFKLLSSNFLSLDDAIYDQLSIADKISNDILVLKNITTLSSVQVFEGSSVPLPINFIEINKITDQQVINTSKSCGFIVSQSGNAFVLEAGTYKMRMDARVTSLCSTPTWIQVFLYQNTMPAHVLLYGSSFAATGENQIGNLFLEHCFSLCRLSTVSIRIKTNGKFNLGLPVDSMIQAAGSNASLLSSFHLSSCNMNVSIQNISGISINETQRVQLPDVPLEARTTFAQVPFFEIAS